MLIKHNRTGEIHSSNGWVKKTVAFVIEAIANEHAFN